MRYQRMMNPLIFILLLSAMHSSTGFVNLECTPQQPYVCAGYEIICLCTASSSETIFWDDNNTLPSFSTTQLCNSCTPDTSSAVRLEVINCPSCSNNFTSRLSYNVSLGMGNIQIGCFISPDPSRFENWCVANCTVPAVPSSCSVTLLSYNQSSRRLLFIDTAWNSVPDTVDTCPGPNIIHYLIQLSFQNGSVTENVNIARCTAARCSHTFEPPTNPPSSYNRVSVAAENVVGVGAARTCTTQTISATNNLLTGEVVDLSSSSDATLNCTFLSGFTGSARCRVQYGTDPTYMNLPYSSESAETGTAGDTVSVVLRERLNSSTVYYYNVSANNGDATVTVQGTFTTPEYMLNPTSTPTVRLPIDNAGIITGAVVGAVTVVGGIVLIAALTMLFYCCQKKLHSTSLHEAAEQGNLDAVIKHLVHKGTDINTKDELRMSALHKAAEGGHMDIVRYLIENKADISIQERIGRAPLHVAAEEGHTNIVEYLIDQGADIVITDMSKRTPLHLAAGKGHMDTVKCLVNKGTIINIKDETGRTPQDVATGEGHEDIAEYLKKARETVL